MCNILDKGAFTENRKKTALCDLPSSQIFCLNLTMLSIPDLESAIMLPYLSLGPS